MTLSVATSSAEMQRLDAAREGWKPVQVTICGGGNGAHVAAGFLASRGIRWAVCGADEGRCCRVCVSPNTGKYVCCATHVSELELNIQRRGLVCLPVPAAAFAPASKLLVCAGNATLIATQSSEGRSLQEAAAHVTLASPPPSFSDS